MFRQMFFPVGFQPLVSPPLGFLNSLLIPGDQTKNQWMYWQHTYIADVNI